MSILKRKIQNGDIKNFKTTIDEANILKIPEFQRNYSWSQENFEEFINDIFELKEKKELIFFGILFFRRKNNYNEFDIIDGQQRLTTLMLIKFLILKKCFQLKPRNIHEEIFKIKTISSFSEEYTNFDFEIKKFDEIDDDNFEELKEDFYEFIEEELNQQNILKIKNEFKFKISNEEGNISFISILRNIFLKEKKENKKEIYYKAFQEIENILEKKMKENKWNIFLSSYEKINEIIENKIIFSVLTVDKEENYFNFFRDLNSKGVELNTFDFVNLYIINFFKGIKKEGFLLDKEIKKEYKEIQSFYKKDAKSNKIKKYYEFWRTSLSKLNESYFDKNKYDENPFKKLNFLKKGEEEKWFEDFLKDPKKNNNEKIAFLKDLIEAINLLKNIEEEEDNNYVSYIKLLNRKQVYPILVALKRKKIENEKIEEIMQKVIHISFIKLTVQKLSPGDFKHETMKFIDKINKNNYFDEFFYNEFKINKAKYEDYEKIVINKDNVFENKQLLYIHTKIFQESTKNLGFKIDFLNKLSLEHTISKNNPLINNDENFKSKKNSLVSTTFLPMKINNKLKNKTPIEKMEILFNTDPTLKNSPFYHYIKEEFNVLENYEEKISKKINRLIDLKFLEI